MTGRIELLEPAIRAQGALIVEAQREIERYLTKEIESADLVNRLIPLFDGPEQREAERGLRGKRWARSLKDRQKNRSPEF
jgi:hypothetical protein